MAVTRKWRASVLVTLQTGVLDPQGSAIAATLHGLGYSEVTEVRQGKYFEIDLSGDNEKQVFERVQTACSTMIANAVIESWKIEISPL